MPSMDYCKFENTAIDMAKCLAHLEEGRSIPSSSELRGYRRLLDLCQSFVDEADYFTPELEDQE